MVATIPSPGRLLLHAQNDPGIPTTRSAARCARCSKPRRMPRAGPFEIIELPAPETLRDEEGFVDWSYVNHLVVNGGVIACGYRRRAGGRRGRDILAEAYPGRRVVTVDARPILARGGGIHCITQQQPTLDRPVA